jgi:hypothetical protein
VEIDGGGAEDLGGEPVEQGGDRRLVDVAERRVLAGSEVVELVAVQPVDGTGGDVERHLGQCQDEDPAQGQRWKGSAEGGMLRGRDAVR